MEIKLEILIFIYSGGTAEPSVTSKTVFGPRSRSMQVSSLSWGYCLSRGKSHNYQGDYDIGHLMMIDVKTLTYPWTSIWKQHIRAKIDNFIIVLSKFGVDNFYVQQCFLVQYQCYQINVYRCFPRRWRTMLMFNNIS